MISFIFQNSNSKINNLDSKLNHLSCHLGFLPPLVNGWLSPGHHLVCHLKLKNCKDENDHFLFIDCEAKISILGEICNEACLKAQFSKHSGLWYFMLIKFIYLIFVFYVERLKRINPVTGVQSFSVLFWLTISKSHHRSCSTPGFNTLQILSLSSRPRALYTFLFNYIHKGIQTKFKLFPLSELQ